MIEFKKIAPGITGLYSRRIRNFFRSFSKKVSNHTTELLISFIIFLVSLIGLEIVLVKINYPHQGCKVVITTAEKRLGQFDPKTGWSYQSNFSFYSFQDDYEYHFNSDGIRIAQPQKDIDFSKPRIVFIGGSVTFGEQLNYEDTFINQIKELLDNKYEVVNLGVQAYGTAQAMLALERHLEALEPTYVVYLFIPDHIQRNINHDRRLRTQCLSFDGTKPVYKLDSQNNLKLDKKPQPYQTYDSFKIPLLIKSSYQRYREELMNRNGQAIEITEKLVDRIAYLSRSAGAQDLYIYYDSVYDPSPNNHHHFLKKAIFSDKEDMVLDFTNWAPDSEEPGTKYYVDETDDSHPNASLSARLAEEFVEKFKLNFIYNQTHD